MRILFVGDCAPFQTTEARRDAFLALGLPLTTVDPREDIGVQGPNVARLGYWTLRTPAVYAFNRRILTAAASFGPDVVWIEKGVYVFPSTLRRLHRDRSRLLVYHNTDDWKGQVWTRRVHWRYLLRTLRRYDVHVTSNLHNVREFREAGLPRVHHMELAAHPGIRLEGAVRAEDRERLGAPVGFIGHWEPFTESLMLHLLDNGIPLKIYGHQWHNARPHPKLDAAATRATVWGGEYAKTVCSFDINLGIVSSMNRSHTATRTFQVPALGAFLLHQRNEVVSRYYQEGKEAEFFDSKEELLEKCRYYLEHPAERARVAAAGRKRCLESGYTETDRVREVIPLLERALAEKR